MLVIHPEDTSTRFLHALYGGMEGVDLHTGEESRNRLSSLLYHLQPGEPVMLLGHGSPDGLFRKEGEEYQCYVGRSMRFLLRGHPLIGIWCHANLFAQRNSLHGLFSGMVVSEMDEARDYGIMTTEAELEVENRRFAATLRGLLDTNAPERLVPRLMKEKAGKGPAVRVFNFNSMYYL
jgi:hypothetical protein